MDIVHGLSQRMRMETHVAFVDTGSYFGITSSERQTVHAAVQAIAAKFNFPCSILPLEDVFVDIPAAEDRRTKLNELINSGTTLTAKEDILSSVIRLRVIQQAKELKYSRVLLTQTSTEMAINVISGCAKGRGHQLAAEVATVARLPDEGISIVQPFKDILLAETEYYFHMERLSHVKTPHISGVLQKHLSINRLTEGLFTLFLLSCSYGYQNLMVTRPVRFYSRAPGRLPPDRTHCHTNWRQACFPVWR
jgi:cytoplasmic tRNA 2-thiolation protein 2